MGSKTEETFKSLCLNVYFNLRFIDYCGLRWIKIPVLLRHFLVFPWFFSYSTLSAFQLGSKTEKKVEKFVRESFLQTAFGRSGPSTLGNYYSTRRSGVVRDRNVKRVRRTVFLVPFSPSQLCFTRTERKQMLGNALVKNVDRGYVRTYPSG